MVRIGQVLQKAVAAMTVLANDIAIWPRCAQQSARVAQRLALALSRCRRRGRPGGVITRPDGPTNVKRGAQQVRCQANAKNCC